MTAEEVLAKAADRVEQGWGQGAYVDPTGKRVCTMGAMRWAVSGSAYMTRDLLASDGYLAAGAAMECEVGASISQWNDAPGRTVEEVATTLRNAKRWL